MNNIERIKEDYEKMKVVGKELVSSYQQGYIGKDTYKVILANGKEVIVDTITKNKSRAYFSTVFIFEGKKWHLQQEFF
jgi:transcriptional/translational regulatory protein YebC/TACO1